MFFLGLYLLFLPCFVFSTKDQDLIVFTVATDINDGFQRLMRSAKLFNYDIKVLGKGILWKGGDVNKFPGGGQKILLLKEALAPYINDFETLVLFVDGYDVVFLRDKNELLRWYHEMDAKVVFSAEKFCWPNPSLSIKYPKVNDNESRYLNSGVFIGPASILYKLVSENKIIDSDDDQLYFTNMFLDTKLRTKFDIHLDIRSEIFQNLNGALDDLTIEFDQETGYIVNTKTGMRPTILHGNGPVKMELNSLTNYLAKSWNPTKGCMHCLEDNIMLRSIHPNNHPIIQLSLFITVPTPFLEAFFSTILNFTYPKDRIYLTLYCNVQQQLQMLLDFNSTHGHSYRSSVLIDANKYSSELFAKYHAWSNCLGYEDCAFVMYIDAVARITNPQTIDHLIAMNRNMLAPLMTRPGKLWSNFWGALGRDGYYARSNDYLDIVSGKQRGIWNVPFVSSAYLLSRWTVRQLATATKMTDTPADLAIATSVRDKNIFLLVDNQLEFGHLINADSYSFDHLHSDLWQLFDNPTDWEARYIHRDYFHYLNESVLPGDFEQPCPDVYWLPLLSEAFCAEIIAEMERFGQWSSGGNTDPRLEGGYENVPTIDIHMRQIDWEAHWMHILRTYIHPIQKKLYQGYNDEPSSRMSFIVRYKPDEQPILRPHHDSSTYTLNIALNRPGIDYEGGGARFIRYNCSIVESRLGWSLIHPGRLTHLHEGLRTTSGTRYIFVTFINP